MSPNSLAEHRPTMDRLRWLLLAFFRDLVAFVLSAFLAFELRFDGLLPTRFHHGFWVALAVWPTVKMASFAVAGVNRGYWRYTSLYDAQRIALANTASSFLGGLTIVLLLGPGGIPRSIYILEWIISCFLILGGRLIIRAAVIARSTRRSEGVGVRTLIYGAGSAGLQLLCELRQNPTLMCDVVGLVDDDPAKVGLILDGKQVLGTGEALSSLARKNAIKRVLIAIPSATGPQMVRILKLASDAGVEYKMVPSLGDLVRDKQLGGQIRNIAVEDLLGRQSVHLNLAHIRERIEGRVVMVTGAAGSIGSELCRQIARFNPAALIGFDQAETPLFQIDRELRNSFPKLLFHPEIGDVSDSEHLGCVMKQFHPAILYHAAAYKHVPLMERHVFAAVENNIFGTWQTAIEAIRYGVEDFVMISTDKAVRPTSMMGATKRIAELVIRALQNESDTRFVAVRFGNVLGSNGSVVPIFKEQIASGGPVTVTHPEMRRYFMTIPEAAQLVLQAFSIGKGGDVFLLDMGEPVKIVDLAINLILLSGLKPEKDIKIQFTGLRPGEKLFEELNLNNESLLPTLHSKIRRYASPSELKLEQIRAHMNEMEEIVLERNITRLVHLLEKIIPDYSPSASLVTCSPFVEPSQARIAPIETTMQREPEASGVSFAPLPEIG